MAAGRTRSTGSPRSAKRREPHALEAKSRPRQDRRRARLRRTGPLSFETQWYDWSYAQSMVSRIRVNWYANMPQIIRTGLQGVVTIRFTIQRDGRITDLELLSSSGVPPYDYAARKAIELSSRSIPSPGLPESQRARNGDFYYNKELPGGERGPSERGA